MSVTIYINPSQEYSYDLIDFLQRETWSGAYDRMNSATDKQLEDAVSALQCIFKEPTELTTINDYLWFECDDIFYSVEDEEDEEDEE